MSIDEQHIALPKLYGAPAYARPPSTATVSPRPFDPDELPIEAVRTDDERAFAESLPARMWAPGGSSDLYHGGGTGSGGGSAEPRIAGRPLSLRALAGRLFGGD